MRAKFSALKQTHDVRLRAKFLLDTGLFCRSLPAKPPILPFFWTLAFCGVASWHQCEKVEHGCTTTNFPRSNGVKIVSVLQRLHGETWGAQPLTFKSVTNKQTDKQTKNSVFSAAPAAGEIRAPPNLAW